METFENRILIVIINLLPEAICCQAVTTAALF